MVMMVLLLPIIMVMTKDRERVLWGRLTLEQGIGSGGLGLGWHHGAASRRRNLPPFFVLILVILGNPGTLNN